MKKILIIWIALLWGTTIISAADGDKVDFYYEIQNAKSNHPDFTFRPTIAYSFFHGLLYGGNVTMFDSAILPRIYFSGDGEVSSGTVTGVNFTARIGYAKRNFLNEVRNVELGSYYSGNVRVVEVTHLKAPTEYGVAYYGIFKGMNMDNMVNKSLNYLYDPSKPRGMGFIYGAGFGYRTSEKFDLATWDARTEKENKIRHYTMMTSVALELLYATSPYLNGPGGGFKIAGDYKYWGINVDFGYIFDSKVEYFTEKMWISFGAQIRLDLSTKPYRPLDSKCISKGNTIEQCSL